MRPARRKTPVIQPQAAKMETANQSDDEARAHDGNRSLIQLTRMGAVFSGSKADLRDLREQFKRDHYIILPKLIEPELFRTIMRRVDSAKFQRREFDGVVSQSVMDEPATYHILFFLANMPSLHRLIERITGCRRIASFRGRVYQLMPVSKDHIEWHSDMSEHRMLAFSLNLTRKVYSGGSLQIRYKNSEKLLHEIQNTGLGDALLMRVAKKLRHRVLPVEGDVPRTAMAGWFRWGKDDYYDDLRKTVASTSVDPKSGDFGH
jgi:hypothetical protein